MTRCHTCCWHDPWLINHTCLTPILDACPMDMWHESLSHTLVTWLICHMTHIPSRRAFYVCVTSISVTHIGDMTHYHTWLDSILEECPTDVWHDTFSRVLVIWFNITHDVLSHILMTWLIYQTWLIPLLTACPLDMRPQLLSRTLVTWLMYHTWLTESCACHDTHLEGTNSSNSIKTCHYITTKRWEHIHSRLFAHPTHRFQLFAARAASHCNTVQHAATRCNTLQHAAKL